MIKREKEKREGERVSSVCDRASSCPFGWLRVVIWGGRRERERERKSPIPEKPNQIERRPLIDSPAKKREKKRKCSKKSFARFQMQLIHLKLNSTRLGLEKMRKAKNKELAASCLCKERGKERKLLFPSLRLKLETLLISFPKDNIEPSFFCSWLEPGRVGLGRRVGSATSWWLAFNSSRTNSLASRLKCQKEQTLWQHIR